MFGFISIRTVIPSVCSRADRRLVDLRQDATSGPLLPGVVRFLWGEPELRRRTSWWSWDWGGQVLLDPDGGTTYAPAAECQTCPNLQFSELLLSPNTQLRGAASICWAWPHRPGCSRATGSHARGAPVINPVRHVFISYARA